MADITITIPTDKLDDVIAAFKDKYRYEEVLDDGTDNTESGAAFAKRMLVEHIKRITLKYLKEQAGSAVTFDLE